jgi:HAD superfamily hydrolase (TIGR01509 family)
MDGVIMNNNSYHEIAWREFCKKHGIQLTDEELHEFVFGRVAKDTLEFIFGKKLMDEEIDRFVEEKEIIYRSIYQKHIRPLDGLIELLDDLKDNQIPMALATSAPPENISFTFRFIPIESYFQFQLNASHITKGKPDPEIYIKAIQSLSLPPENCIVFEDSLSGIRAAIGAGAKVIGVSTTHKAEELKDVKKVIPDFKGLTCKDLLRIMDIS